MAVSEEAALLLAAAIDSQFKGLENRLAKHDLRIQKIESGIATKNTPTPTRAKVTTSHWNAIKASLEEMTKAENLRISGIALLLFIAGLGGAAGIAGSIIIIVCHWSGLVPVIIQIKH